MKTKLSRKKMKKAMRRAAPAAIPAALGLGAAIGALAATFGRAPIESLLARVRRAVEDRASVHGRSAANGAGRPIVNPISAGI